jgi:tripartite-type tricarboxylate transporter receptor subunit TctC
MLRFAKSQKIRRSGGISMRKLLALTVVIGLGCLPQAASAQAYPKRPITMIVPFAAGGATDVIARIVSEAMSRELGQPIVVENVAGAGGTTGSVRAKNAAADGYTLLTGHMGTHASSYALYTTPRYDPRSDFEPIGLVASAPIVLFSRPNLAENSLDSFISYAKAHPTTVGHSGVGSNAHLTCALFNSMTGLKPTEVPYRGNAPLMSDITAGNIDYSCDQIITLASQIAGGQVKGIAITGNSRSPLVPEVPTFVEAGLPKFDADAWTALFVPRGVPADVVSRVHEAYLSAIKSRPVIERLSGLGAVIPTGESLGPEYLRVLVARDLERWAKVVQDANIPRQ